MLGQVAMVLGPFLRIVPALPPHVRIRHQRVKLLPTPSIAIWDIHLVIR